jgi:hypothetical protein
VRVQGPDGALALATPAECSVASTSSEKRAWGVGAHERVLVELRVTNMQQGRPLNADLALHSEYRGQSQSQQGGDKGAGLPALWNGSTTVRISSVSREFPPVEYPRCMISVACSLQLPPGESFIHELEVYYLQPGLHLLGFRCEDAATDRVCWGAEPEHMQVRAPAM